MNLRRWATGALLGLVLSLSATAQTPPRPGVGLVLSGGGARGGRVAGTGVSAAGRGMSGIDWPGLMRAGMGRLGLTPDQFWRLSPVELRIMLGAEAAVPPFTRARLEELAAAYPDQGKGKDHGRD